MSSELDGAPGQARALDAILEAWSSGRPIRTTQDLANKIGVSKTAAYNAVKGLRRRELIEQETAGFRARTASITPTSKAWVQRPDLSRDGEPRAVPLARVLGKAAAGDPVFIGEADTEYIQVPPLYANRSDAFAVKVQGDSMNGDGIFDGDYVIVVPEPDPQQNSMVLALIGGQDEEAAVKRFFREDSNTVMLKSSNPNYKPIKVESDVELLIQGKIVGVVRWNVT